MNFKIGRLENMAQKSKVLQASLLSFAPIYKISRTISPLISMLHHKHDNPLRLD